jgi:epoxide hydrolase-like predicted phosphatase
VIAKELTLAIETVIWDMGGVILRTEDPGGRRRWERRLGLSTGELEHLVFNGELSRLASLGRATPEQIWGDLARRFDLTAEERKELERDFWGGDAVDRELLAYIRRLRPRRKTGLLSNGWSDVREHIEGAWDFADAFDQIVISAEVGLVKPDPRVYELALKRLGTQPARAVFVDDFPQNVQGAQEVGMRAIQFLSPQQVQRELDRLLAGEPDT